jgi:hypothetical protein
MSHYYWAASDLAWKIIHSKKESKKSSLMNELINGVWNNLTEKERLDIMNTIKSNR